MKNNFIYAQSLQANQMAYFVDNYQYTVVITVYTDTASRYLETNGIMA